MLEKLKSYTPQGKLKGIPLEIIGKMVEYQVEQGYPLDLTVFEREINADKKQKGFTWIKTKEGYDFWLKVLKENKFYEFFMLYPRPENSNKLRFVEGLKLKEGSHLKGFPLEIIDKMIENQVNQGNTANLEVFEKNPSASKIKGGFDWDKSPEGNYFWISVIYHYDFLKFFLKYPYKDLPNIVLSENKPIILLDYNKETNSGKGFSKKDKVVKVYNNISYLKPFDYATDLRDVKKVSSLIDKIFENKFSKRKVKIESFNCSLTGIHNIIFNKDSESLENIISPAELLYHYKPC